jgi:hypothetical protein
VLPGLGEHARRLEQHARGAEARIDLHQETRRGAPALGGEPVGLLDAALGVATVATHVPFAERAIQARHRVGMSHDADDHVADAEAAVRGRIHDTAERFVAEHQPLVAGASFTVSTVDQLAVGPAHADREGAHQDRALLARRLFHLAKLQRSRLAGRDGHRLHIETDPAGTR